MNSLMTTTLLSTLQQSNRIAIDSIHMEMAAKLKNNSQNHDTNERERNEDRNNKYDLFASNHDTSISRNDYREHLYSTKGESSYHSVLERLQTHLTAELTEDIDKIDEVGVKDKISKCITDYNIKCSLTDSISTLTNYLYHDMSGYSFISREKLFETEGFEELDINSWEDVDIVIKGQAYKTNYAFLSPSHAIDIHRRLLRKTNTVLDDAMPIAVTDLGPKIRIGVIKSPIVDEDVGIVSSIRKVDSETATREKLLSYGSLTEEMLDFLELASQKGISICFAGETGAGKTFLSGYILDKAAEKMRVYTIEEGSREWNFVKRGEDGRIKNSVIHTKTRPSDNPSLNITQETLLETALRFNADIFGVGEMRSREAYTAAESGRTGHAVITTTHSDSAMDTPYRILELAKKAHDFSDHTLLSMITKSFPLIVYVEKLADHKRRVTEIVEIGYANGEVTFNPLWEYRVTDNLYTEIKHDELNFLGTKIETIGEFNRLNPVSTKLAQKMLKKGATAKQLAPFTEVRAC